MITGIEIENFKGIRERVRIDLRPITLLFGANSAGKSSILHAILYASEVLERRNLDADSTVAGGESVNLGGFKNLVHAHDLDRTVWLRLAFPDEEEFHESLWFRDLPSVNEVLQISEYFNGTADSFLDPDGVSIELGISWSSFRDVPYISEYRLFAREPRRVRFRKGDVDSSERPLLARVTSDASGQRVALSGLNLAHGALLTPDDWDHRVDAEDQESLPSLSELAYDPQESLLSLCLKECGHCFQSISSEGVQSILPEASREFSAPAILLLGQVDALPTLGKSLQLALRYKHDVDRRNADEDEFERIYSLAKEVANELSFILSKPLELATHFLQSSRYLGPIREVPPRDFRPAKSTDAAAAQGRSQWASGRGAWEELIRDEKLVQDTNAWLSDRLEAGYSIEHLDFREISSLIVKMWSESAFDAEGLDIQVDSFPRGTRLILRPTGSEITLEPADVGIGISQVVPVIVTAISGVTGLQIIEQPELHLHPRLQAELGDLFVSNIIPEERYQAIVSTVKQFISFQRDEYLARACQYFLIETHSEHLILRMLRRIRETADIELPNLIRPLSPDDIAVFYLEGGDKSTTAIQLRIDNEGEFVDQWPKGFFEERARELF